MKTTKFIVFDYGETLAHEEEFNIRRGNERIYNKINNGIISFDDFCIKAKEVYEYVYGLKKKINIEIVFQNYLRLLLDVCEIKYDGNLLDLEREFVDACYTLVPIEGANEILEYLNKKEIKTAVLSNTTISAESLSFLIKKVFPFQNFEFVMTSSDYIIKKPEILLFEAMQKKCGCNKENIIFCGDKPHRDIEGAKRFGIRGVLLDQKNIYQNEGIKIQNYKELINYLEAEEQNED